MIKLPHPTPLGITKYCRNFINWLFLSFQKRCTCVLSRKYFCSKYLRFVSCLDLIASWKFIENFQHQKNVDFNPTWHKIFFGGLDMGGGGWNSPPPGKHTSGTSMSSNHLVTHRAHKNGQYYALKSSKILFNCIRDSRMTQEFQFFKNFKLPQ